MPHLRDSVGEYRQRISETLREARQDLAATTGGSDERTLAELNPPVARPEPAPWDEIWRSRQQSWHLLVLSLVLTPACGVVLALIYRPLGSAAAILGFLTFAYSVVRLSLFACPRCGRRFDTVKKTKRRRWSNAFTRRCLYCGLEVGTRH